MRNALPFNPNKMNSLRYETHQGKKYQEQQSTNTTINAIRYRSDGITPTPGYVLQSSDPQFFDILHNFSVDPRLAAFSVFSSADPALGSGDNVAAGCGATVGFGFASGHRSSLHNPHSPLTLELLGRLVADRPISGACGSLWRVQQQVGVNDPLPDECQQHVRR